jgi:hypothetical protein
MTEDNCMQEISQVLTLANWRGSKSCGRIVPEAGAAMARAAPKTTSSAKTSSTGACCQETIPRPSDDRPVMAAAARARFRRGKRSAALPAGSINSSDGARVKTPTRPSAHGSPVRSYSSQPTATETIC